MLVIRHDLFKKNIEHDPVVILEFTLDVHFESRFWSERTCFFNRKFKMARMKNTKRGIGSSQRGQQRGVAAAKYPQKQKEKEKDAGKEKKDNPDEPQASTSKATPPDLNIKSGAPKQKMDPAMKLTMQQKILKEQKSMDLCCSKHFFVKSKVFF